MRLKERKGRKSLFVVHLRELSEGEEKRKHFGKERGTPWQEGAPLELGLACLSEGALVCGGGALRARAH
jgi:hypothetical protein